MNKTIKVQPELKRLNPETGAPFKRGYLREDGKVFYTYTNIVSKKTGLYREIWLSPGADDRQRERDRENHRVKAANGSPE